jgi:glycosyltransferase involved in cell wall biosynthesis
MFIEETIRSILLQGYPDLEFFVLDGGSTDNTVEVIRKYAHWITFWVSEPDGGQSSAINCGLRMGSGDLATWINSDDMLCQDALASHFSTVAPERGAVYVGDCVNIDQTGKFLFRHRGHVRSLRDLVSIRGVWRSGGSIDQPAVLFPLDLALRVGGLNERNHYTMDYELWGRFLLAGAKIEYTGIPFGIFRWHEGQKTQDNIRQTESTLEVAEALVHEAGSLSAEAKREILAELEAYREAYPVEIWRQSGRLAKMGLPPFLVNSARSIRQTIQKTISHFRRTDRSK